MKSARKATEALLKPTTHKSQPTAAPKTVTEIRNVIVLDMSAMFRVTMAIGLVGIAASIALIIFVPYLMRAGAAGLAGFTTLFGMSFLSNLMLPYAMYIAVGGIVLLLGGVAYLVYHLTRNNNVLQDLVPHTSVEHLQDTLKTDTLRVVRAIKNKAKV